MAGIGGGHGVKAEEGHGWAGWQGGRHGRQAGRLAGMQCRRGDESCEFDDRRGQKCRCSCLEWRGTNGNVEEVVGRYGIHIQAGESSKTRE